MIPVFVKTSDWQTPDEPLFYLVAANGTFLVRNTPTFSATIKAEQIAGLNTEVERISLRCPKVPQDIMARVVGFFRFAYRRWDAEAIVFLYYSPDRREFKVEIPPQFVRRFFDGHRWRTEGRVRYGAVARPDGYLKLGDLHSHGDEHAFFSTTDDRDDAQDGLRIVIGRLDRANVEVCASFVVGGRRFELAPEDVIEPCPGFLASVPPPPHWTRRLVCRHEIEHSALNRWRGWHYEH